MTLTDAYCGVPRLISKTMTLPTIGAKCLLLFLLACFHALGLLCYCALGLLCFQALMLSMLLMLLMPSCSCSCSRARTIAITCACCSRAHAAFLLTGCSLSLLTGRRRCSLLIACREGPVGKASRRQTLSNILLSAQRFDLSLSVSAFGCQEHNPPLIALICVRLKVNGCVTDIQRLLWVKTAPVGETRPLHVHPTIRFCLFKL